MRCFFFRVESMPSHSHTSFGQASKVIGLIGRLFRMLFVRISLSHQCIEKKLRHQKLARPKTRRSYVQPPVARTLAACPDHHFFAGAFLWVGRVKIMRKKRDTQQKQTNTRWLKRLILIDERRKTDVYNFFCFFFQIHYSILGVRARNEKKKCEHQTTYFANFLLRPRIFTYLFISHSKCRTKKHKYQDPCKWIECFAIRLRGTLDTQNIFAEIASCFLVCIFFSFFWSLNKSSNSICSLALAKHSKLHVSIGLKLVAVS